MFSFKLRYLLASGHDSVLQISSLTSSMGISETSRYQSIYGQPLILSVIHHDKCLEYILEKPSVPVYKLPSFYFMWMFLILTIVSILLEKYIFMLVSFILLLFFLYKIPWEIKKESLLMVPNVGLQLNTVYRWGCERTSYISRLSVKSVLISEAIIGQKILFYLSLVIKQPDNGKGKLIPLFLNTMPRLNCLEQIYRSIHEILIKE